MKFSKVKGTRWFDFSTKKEIYGIRIFHNGKWIEATERNGPMFFDNESARNARMSELKA